jgi:hypothetical protein
MPFDTTYNLIHDNASEESLSITIPGGKDTVINITEDELPDLLIRHPEISEPLYKYQHAPDTPEPKNNNGIAFLEVILLIVVVIILNSIIRNFPRWRKGFKKDLVPKIIYPGILHFPGDQGCILELSGIWLDAVNIYCFCCI